MAGPFWSAIFDAGGAQHRARKPRDFSLGGIGGGTLERLRKIVKRHAGDDFMLIEHEEPQSPPFEAAHFNAPAAIWVKKGTRSFEKGVCSEDVHGEEGNLVGAAPPIKSYGEDSASRRRSAMSSSTTCVGLLGPYSWSTKACNSAQEM